ncbi:MAG: hypothetical protein JWL94_1691, partial [Microbacteriaceae bacterium]|nr:hypothetical protein [Microbacteriaceae bacterium]
MRVIRVTDLNDPTLPGDPGLADYARLTDVSLRRVSEPAGGLYIAESSKVMGRAIAAGHLPRSVLLQEQWLDALRPLLDPFDIPVYVGDAGVLESLTGYNLHRGALAAMHRPERVPADQLRAGARRVVILEDIVDHTNVGAVFRA